MSREQILSAAAAGTFTIGGDLIVNRMGYGAMRITGPGIWGHLLISKLRLRLCREPSNLA
jgi:hypothetical protein